MFALNAAGSINAAGATPDDTAAAARMGMSRVAVAVLDVTSVRNVITTQIPTTSSATLDTTADAGAEVVATLTDGIDGNDDSSVTVSFANLDDDFASGEIVFSDGTTDRSASFTGS